MREIHTPDGHLWRVERFHAPRQSHRDRLFWPSLLGTLALLALWIFLLATVGGAGVWIAGIAVLAIWAVERISYLMRPSIRASTDGPPPQSLVWKTRHRYGYDRIEAQIAQEIARGDIGSEPEGATLVSTR